MRAELVNQPDVLADLEKEIGRAYHALHDAGKAIVHLQAAVQGYDRLGTATTEPAIEARLLLAGALSAENRLLEARGESDRALSFATKQLGEGHPLALEAVLSQGHIDIRSGRSPSAAARYRSVIDMLDRTDSLPSPLRLRALRALAWAQFDLEQLAAAASTGERIETEIGRLGNVNVSARLDVERQKAMLWFDQGRYAEVLDALPSLVGRLEAHLGTSANAVHVAQAYWAASLAAVGRYEEAVDVETRNLARAANRVTADNEEMAFHHQVAAVVLYEAGRFEEALAPARQSLAFLSGSPHSVAEIATARLRFGLLKHAAGEAGGVEEARSGVNAYAGIPGRQDHASLAEMIHWLAAVEHAAGNDAAALRRPNAPRRSGVAEAQTRRRSIERAVTPWRHGCVPSRILATRARPMLWKAAARDYAALRTPLHLSHADLGLMDAEVSARAGNHAEAERAKSAATKRWQRSTGRPLPRFVTLH